MKTSQVGVGITREAGGLVRLEIKSLHTDLKLSSIGPLVEIHGQFNSLPYVVSSSDAKRVEVIAHSITNSFNHSLYCTLITGCRWERVTISG